MPSGFSFTGDDIGLNIKILNAKLKVAVDAVVDREAVMGETTMKVNAPWHDDTGAARSGLFTVPYSLGDKHTIIFAHSVHYGIWLEVKNSGKFEIIMPSVRKTGHDLMGDLSHLMRKL